MKRTNLICCILLLCLGYNFIACTSRRNDEKVKKISGSLDLLYAERFAVHYLDSGKIGIKVTSPWSGSNDEISKEYIIDPGHPAQSIVCLSSPHIEMLVQLGLQDRIVGIPSFEDVYSDTLRQFFIEKGVKEVGNSGKVNFELLIDLSPDLIIESAVGNSMDANQALEEMGLPVVLFSAYMENHPLGRLEWIKYLSLFVGELDKATDYFNRKVQEYNVLKEKIETRIEKPKVFAGYRWKDNWYAPGGRGYMAQFIQDAGGQYVLKQDTSSGNIKLSHETVIELLEGCDIWLHPGHQVNTISQLQEMDIPASYFDNGLQVYNNNKRISSFQKNDFWQSGFVYPDRVLKDLVMIFKDKKGSLTYYTQIK